MLKLQFAVFCSLFQSHKLGDVPNGLNEVAPGPEGCASSFPSPNAGLIVQILKSVILTPGDGAPRGSARTSERSR